MKLVDLFVDYSDIDQAVHWTQFYHLKDCQIPDQVRLRRQEILHGGTMPQSVSNKPSMWSTQQSSDENVYKPNVLPNDIVYIEMDSDVDGFLTRLEVRGDELFFFEFVDHLFLSEVFSMYGWFAFAIRRIRL